MSLLAEYAVTPDVFDSSSYTHEDVCGLYIGSLKESFLQGGLVRDLRSGEWARLLRTGVRPWHRRTKELLEALKHQSRLVSHSPALAAPPASDIDWCREALATHARTPLTGVIVSKSIHSSCPGAPIVAAVEMLTGVGWWGGRTSSIRLGRTFSHYERALELVLRHSTSLMFIDPHLDPGKPRYADLVPLLQMAGRRIPTPRLEIHRARREGSGRSVVLPDPASWEASFRSALNPALKSAGLTAEVFLWNEFHDRYLISNLIGIGMPNGFDTTTASDVTTWSRLSRESRDDVQREFDPAANRHDLKHRFRIP